MAVAGPNPLSLRCNDTSPEQYPLDTACARATPPSSPSPQLPSWTFFSAVSPPYKTSASAAPPDGPMALPPSMSSCSCERAPESIARVRRVTPSAVSLFSPRFKQMRCGSADGQELIMRRRPETPIPLLPKVSLMICVSIDVLCRAIPTSSAPSAPILLSCSHNERAPISRIAKARSLALRARASSDCRDQSRRGKQPLLRAG
mmetsp:Transcript_3911/g.12443  ORF Transcript_3911/g.12443 Transcript_3911/m.12443 type:complete len:203 (-) Transcript_3911:1136-1744(-)|eukprot:scaffold100964_cov36-Tisochrysis_lutea.AAC.1